MMHREDMHDFIVICLSPLICIYIYIYIYVYVCVCVCKFINKYFYSNINLNLD